MTKKKNGASSKLRDTPCLPTSPNTNGSSAENAISLLESSDEEDNNALIYLAEGGGKTRRRSNPDVSVDDEEDEIMIVDSSTMHDSIFESLTTSSSSKPPSAGRSKKGRKRSRSCSGLSDAEEEVETIGQANVMKLPHLRPHCTEYKFIEDVIFKRTKPESKQEAKEGNSLNPKHCSLCYCFVCDKPVSECKNWSSKGNKEPNHHCLASDKGMHGFFWKRLRNDQKKAVDESQSDCTTNTTSTTNSTSASSQTAGQSTSSYEPDSSPSASPRPRNVRQVNRRQVKKKRVPPHRQKKSKRIARYKRATKT